MCYLWYTSICNKVIWYIINLKHFWPTLGQRKTSLVIFLWKRRTSSVVFLAIILFLMVWYKLLEIILWLQHQTLFRRQYHISLAITIYCLFQHGALYIRLVLTHFASEFHFIAFQFLINLIAREIFVIIIFFFWFKVSFFW